MARSSSSRPDDDDCLRLLATPSPRIRGAEKKESTGLRLSQPCLPYVTPSSISSFGRRLNGAHIVGNVFVKDFSTKRFCQSSANSCNALADLTPATGATTTASPSASASFVGRAGCSLPDRPTHGP